MIDAYADGYATVNDDALAIARAVANANAAAP